jgi:hypothetical protein
MGTSKKKGDFVQQSIVKTAVRELTPPIVDITTFNTPDFRDISGNPRICPACVTLPFLTRNPASRSSTSRHTPRRDISCCPLLCKT